MRLLTEIPFQVDLAGLLSRLHLDPDSEHAPGMRALAEKANAAARPKAVYDEIPIDRKFADGIQVRSVRFTSRAMGFNLKNTTRIYPYICTCGTELDRLPIPPDDGFGQYGLEVVKEQALFAALTALQGLLKKEYGLDKKAAMNPGSGDRKLWPIEEQRPLFDLFGDVEAAIGVRLTESFLMLPNKTVSGFFFPTDKAYHNCQLCRRETCQNRTAPFAPELWRKTVDEHGLEISETADEPPAV